MKTNLREITKGDTWSFTIEAFTDETEATPIDISDYQFVMTAVYASGSTAFTRNNGQIAAPTDFKRVVTLAKNETAPLNAGELYYQIDVTYPDTTAEQWMDGYIIVKA